MTLKPFSFRKRMTRGEAKGTWWDVGHIGQEDVSRGKSRDLASFFTTFPGKNVALVTPRGCFKDRQEHHHN